MSPELLQTYRDAIEADRRAVNIAFCANFSGTRWIERTVIDKFHTDRQEFLLENACSGGIPLTSPTKLSLWDIHYEALDTFPADDDPVSGLMDTRKDVRLATLERLQGRCGFKAVLNRIEAEY